MSLASAPRRFLGLPAPAKLNLFLHVLGRRADGYHEIQSVFVPVGLADTLDFEARRDEHIERRGDLTGPLPADLAVRAAQALRERAQADGRRPAGGHWGVNIEVQKRIPVGAGLGGGSSDAATTLIGLNRLWDLGLTREELARLGRGLGADVAFFLGPGAAFVEGVGERCTPLELPPWWFVLVYPQVAVSTAEIFADPKLTRDAKETTISGFSAALSAVDPARPADAYPFVFGRNDLEPVARARVAAVDEALRRVAQLAPVRMSGSGSAVFSVCAGPAQALGLRDELRSRLPDEWLVWAVEALSELPLAGW